MNIIEKRIDEIIPYEKNPRRNDKAVTYVVNSIKQFGFKVPLVIDKDGVIVCGHTRWKAAKRLKMKTLPCVIADDLTEEQIKAFRLADNKVSEIADWNMALLDEELKELFNFNMADFGFDYKEDDEVIEKIEEDKVEKSPEKKASSGDLWKLGNHYLLCGDATNEKDFERLMQGEKAEMIFTDPPYNVDYEGGTKEKLKIQNDKMGSTEFYNFLVDVFKNMKDNLKDGGAFYVCHAHVETENFMKSLKDCGLFPRQQLIWCKNIFTFGRSDFHWQHEPILYGNKEGAPHRWYGGRKQGTLLEEDFPVEIGMDLDGGNLIVVHIGKKRVVLKAPSVDVVDISDESSLIFVDKPTKNIEHPTMKPVVLVAKCIKNNSKKGEIVLDAFGGSGSTLIACEQLGRKCRMMELDPKYVDVIINRWEKLTGKKAEKIA